ncbi:MAG: AsmA-like C-terminal region-containing protein, partial [Planctomycetota bacterium]
PRMSAETLTGKLVLAGHGIMGQGFFETEASLNSADLNLLLRDLGAESTTTAEAVCDAQISLQGLLWDPKTYRGDGRVQLSEAKLYELPFMIRLMNAASVSAQEGSAFQTATIDFQFDGDHIPLQVYCSGDVLRLKGEGWTNLRRELELDLYSYVGSRFPGNRVVSPLLQESRFATLMLIEVTGTLNNPIMNPRVFPQLEATMQQVFPELANRPAILPWRK